MKLEESKPGGMDPKKILMRRTLGKGSFGKVKEAVHVLTGEKIAVKVLDKEKIVKPEDWVWVGRELSILRRVRHPHIIHVYEIAETDRYIFISMELCAEGDLTTYLSARGRLSEPEACRLFYQLATAVKHLHENGIAHRDLKPANILLDSNRNVRLADFGLGTFFEGDKLTKTQCGSPCFAAPEVISGKHYMPELCDIWGLGVIFFYLLEGELPFHDQNRAVLFSKIQNLDYQVGEFFSEGAVRLLKKILVKDPMGRLTITEILADEWMVQNLRQVRNPTRTLTTGKWDPDLILLAARRIGLGSPAKLKAMLAVGDMNKVTMVYWIFKARKEAGLLSEEDIETIRNLRHDYRQFVHDLDLETSDQQGMLNLRIQREILRGKGKQFDPIKKKITPKLSLPKLSKDQKPYKHQESSTDSEPRSKLFQKKVLIPNSQLTDNLFNEDISPDVQPYSGKTASQAYKKEGGSRLIFGNSRLNKPIQRARGTSQKPELSEDIERKKGVRTEDSRDERSVDDRLLRKGSRLALPPLPPISKRKQNSLPEG